MKKNRIRRFGKPTPPTLMKPEEAQEIDYEICWCMEKLENMIVKCTSDKSKKQCQLSLKLLRNPETSLVRKRQVMRQHFGDYKKAIDNIKRNSVNKCSVSVQYKNNDGHVKSVFVRKKDKTDSAVRMTLMEENTSPIGKTICGIQLSDNSFKFNF